MAAELQHTDAAAPHAGAPRYLQRLSLKQGERTIVLRMDEVVWIEAQDYCVMVHSTRGKHLVRGSLSALEEQLDPEMSSCARIAWRSSTSQHVRETHDRDGLRLVLSDGAEVGVSRSRKSQVETRCCRRDCDDRTACSERQARLPRSAKCPSLQRRLNARLPRR